jgi:hypothetical protein
MARSRLMSQTYEEKSFVSGDSKMFNMTRVTMVVVVEIAIECIDIG